jgi:sugar phosphate isomerase/epimerase
MKSPALSLAELPLPLGPALRLAAQRGFTHVVLRACADRLPEDLEALADSGLLVAGAWLGGGLPEGCSLDAADRAPRRQALDLLKRQAADAARLGATFVLLGPGADASPAGLACFAEAIHLLGEYAAARMLRLCLGHAGGTALPTARDCLTLLEGTRSVSLLLDVAECRRTGEDPLVLLRQAPDRIGCVVLPEPDGLLSGLPATGYGGPLVVRAC